MECPICFHVVHRTIIIPECSNNHWICTECSLQFKKSGAKCPFCRKIWSPSNSLFFAPSRQTFSCCLLNLLMDAVNKIGIFDLIFDGMGISPTIDSTHSILEMKDGTKNTLLQYVIYMNDLVKYPTCEKCELLNFNQFCEFYKALYQVKMITESDCKDWTKIETPPDFDVTLSQLYQPIAEKIQAKQLAENREYLICNKIYKICLNKGEVDIEELYFHLLRQLSSNCPTRKEFETFVELLCTKNYLVRKENKIYRIY